MGSLGSYLADLLIGLFGFSSIIFPSSFFYAGLRVLYGKSCNFLISWVSILLSFSVLLGILLGEVHPSSWGASSPVYSGGITAILLGALFGA